MASRDIKVKWDVDTKKAVSETDKYNKSVTKAGQATKNASKSSNEFRSELGSQIKTMFGLGAVLQLAGSSFNAYNELQAKSAKITFEMAIAAEKTTGRISALGNAFRLANAAQRNALVSGAAAERQLRIQQARTELEGRAPGGQLISTVQRGAAALPIIGGFIKFLQDEVLARSSLGGEGLAESTQASRRAEFVEQAAQIAGKGKTDADKRRIDNAILAELQKQTFNLTNVREAAVQQP